MFTLKHDSNEIEFLDHELSKLGLTNYNKEIWYNIKNDSWSLKPSKKEPKYIYSNTKHKYLHRIIMEYYFGEEIVKNFYSNNYIIEHLDNEGFNCKIENLYFLKNIKNRFKGQYFDKLDKENKNLIALSIYHMFPYPSFQITIGFNTNFCDKRGNILSDIKFLYNNDYEVVLQDAENMLESIIQNQSVNLSEFRDKYRFLDYKINLRSKITLTQEEMKNYHPGMVLCRPEGCYIVLGYEIKNTKEGIKHFIGRIEKVAPDKNFI